MVEQKQLSFDETQEFLKIKKEDITATYMRNMFAVQGDQKEPRYNTYDIIILPKGKFYNDKEIKTTLGRYIFNILCLPEPYLKKYGYYNKTLTTGAMEDLEKIFGQMLLSDELTTHQYGKFFDNTEWLGMGTAYYLAPSVNVDMNVAPKHIADARSELYEKYADPIAKGDNDVSNYVEKTILGMGKEHIKSSKNEAFDLFRAGLFGDVNYKKTTLMTGMTQNPYSGKIKLLKSNYIDGLRKDEYVDYPSIALIGGYSRGVETASGGYQTKRVQNATQNISLGPAGSDCGTTNFIEVDVIDKLKQMYLYRWILDDDGKLKMLLPENIKEYIGTKVKMRSPLFCKDINICSKCAGDLFYRAGIVNAGILSANFSGVLMNLFMKKFHDTSIKFKKIDVFASIKKV